MAEEPWYQRVEREAIEKLQKLLARPLPGGPASCEDNVEDFNPWAMFPSFYGNYGGEFDECALAVLNELLTGDKKRHDLGAEMFREALCNAHLCDYGTSPRVCFPTQGFKALLPALITRWKEYSEAHWGELS